MCVYTYIVVWVLKLIQCENSMFSYFIDFMYRQALKLYGFVRAKTLGGGGGRNCKFSVN